jgi:hypothetical protein
MPEMNPDKGALKAWRLASQQISTRQSQRPGQVVEWLGGVQAQDYRWAKWSIGLRTDGCTDEEVERAIENRQIVRTWMFRGTLHFVSAGDLPWLTSLLAPGIIRRNARRYRELELDDAAFAKSQDVIRHALETHGPLTRSEIKAHFEQEGVLAEGQQVPYLLQRAALDGLICQGSPRGSEPTYVLVANWIGTQQTLGQAEALRLLAMRYFASHGPATQRDLAWWAGLTAREARSTIDSGPEVSPIEVDGVQYWAMGDPLPAKAMEIGCLLPPFDEYLLGYKERSLVLDTAHAKRVNAGGGMPKPAVMVNGDIRGVWSYKTRKQEIAVSIQSFGDLGSRERDLIDRAVSQFGHFKSMPAKVGFDTLGKTA